MSTKPIIMTILLIVTFLLRPPSVSAADPEPAQTTLTIKNLSCGACLNQIHDLLRELDGFQTMTPDLAGRRITVEYLPPLTALQLITALNKGGYPAELTTDTTDQAAPDRNQWYTRGIGCPTCDLPPCPGNVWTWKALFNKYFGPARP